jgi:serine/threonine-protein kinase
MHRDLKPDNVMIGAYGEVYLVDWGIALSLGGDSTSPLPLASASVEMCGTPCYMAPEMLGGVPLDARTDIYLLGALLCEILTGTPPHRTGCLADLMEDIHASAPDLPEDAPPALVAIIRRAMAPDPADRFQDANALAKALQGFQQTRGSQLLADQAEAPLRELLACLSAENVDQQEVYRLFGAARFGYETAVNAWPENQRAATDLDKARVALIQYELAQHHPEAAKALFRDIKERDPKLGERIADAIESRRLEDEELARFRDDSDVRFGTRTRIALTIILGCLWSSLAFLKHYHFDGVAPSYAELFVVTGVFAGLVLGLFFWARRSMRKTEMNRRISRLVLIVFPAHLVLFTGAQAMGMAPATAEVFNMLLWSVVAMAGAATLDVRFWPLALAYAGTFVYSATHPEHRYLAMAAGTMAFVMVGLVVWNGPTKTSLDAPAKR